MSGEKQKRESEIRGDDNETRREFRSERADVLSWMTLEKAQEGSMQSVRRSEDCLGFFQICRFFILDLSCVGLGLSSGRGSLVAIFGRVTNSTTKHTQVLVEAALAFLWGKLSIFAKLVGDRGGVTGG